MRFCGSWFYLMRTELEVVSELGVAMGITRVLVEEMEFSHLVQLSVKFCGGALDFDSNVLQLVLSSILNCCI